MKKLLPILLFTIISSQAQIIDAIAIDVNGEPITTLEIEAVQSKLNMSKKAAVEALIKDRLEKSAIEKANIDISPQDVDAKIAQIAQARKMSKEDMKTALAKNGLTWEAYKKQLSLEMKKEKYFMKNIASSISRPSDEDLKLFYETHKDKFSSEAISQISMIAYASNSSKKLQEAMQNPMRQMEGVQQKSILASSNEMNPQLYSLINSTPEGSFTKPINTGKGFVAYFVKSKSNAQGGFEAVKNKVGMAWIQEERMKASKNFSNKLKNSA
ncbi:MAG: peptidyl-prolyl cis-trans isomerase, partial [Sulfurovaceae bacterium]|nr:peptidyl-prolyl cis-trans isomerase [Sulfurovaceae bacterium]